MREKQASRPMLLPGTGLSPVLRPSPHHHLDSAMLLGSASLYGCSYFFRFTNNWPDFSIFSSLEPRGEMDSWI